MKPNTRLPFPTSLPPSLPPSAHLVDLLQYALILGWAEIIDLPGVRVHIIQERRVIAGKRVVSSAHHIRVCVRTQTTE